MLHKSVFLLPLCILLAQCRQHQTTAPTAVVEECLSKFSIAHIRLYDGVPLGMDFDLRWRVEDPTVFQHFHTTADSIPTKIILPRAEETLRNFAHGFHSVDSVFFIQREYFIQSAKKRLMADLRQDGIVVSAMVLRTLNFPQTYVAAMEAAGLQRQEMERIKRQTAIAVAEAEGERRKTEALSRIQIAQEEANARVRDIQASAETRRRAAELDRAETEVQIEGKKAVIAAERQRQMDKAELDKMAQLNELNQQKNRQSNETELTRNRELAKVYQDNPAYAQFVVNRELAAKVNIAVVPTGLEQGVLGRFLEQGKH